MDINEEVEVNQIIFDYMNENGFSFKDMVNICQVSKDQFMRILYKKYYCVTVDTLLSVANVIGIAPKELVDIDNIPVTFSFF